MHRRQQTSPLQACLAASLPFIVSSSLQLMARRSTSIAVSSVRDANEMLRCRLYNKTAPVRPRAFHTLRVRYALNADSASAGGHLKWCDLFKPECLVNYIALAPSASANCLRFSFSQPPNVSCAVDLSAF